MIGAKFTGVAAVAAAATTAGLFFAIKDGFSEGGVSIIGAIAFWLVSPAWFLISLAPSGNFDGPGGTFVFYAIVFVQFLIIYGMLLGSIVWLQKRFP